jgi:tetratricopeptide (TPR) repeat protein
MSIEADAFQIAYQAHDSGDWLHAAKLYGAVLQEQPQHHQAMFHFGRLCHEVGRHHDARDLMERAIQLAVPDQAANYRISLAAALLSEGRAAEALAQCELARAEVTPTPELLLYQSRAFQALEDLPSACECLQEAIAMDPQHTTVRFALADLLEQQGQMEGAVAQYEAMLEHDGKDARAVLRLSSLMMVEGVGIDDAWLHRIGTAISFADDPELRIQLKFMLAHAYAQRNDSPQALLAYEKANRDLAREAKVWGREFDEQQFAQSAAAVAREFSAVRLERFQLPGNGDLRPIFLLGLPGLRHQALSLELASLGNVALLPERDPLLRQFAQEIGTAESLASHLGEMTREQAQQVADRLRRELSATDLTINRTLSLNPLWILYVGLIADLVPRAQFLCIARSTEAVIEECFHQPLIDNPLVEACTDRTRLATLVDSYQQLLQHWTHVMPAARWCSLREEDLWAGNETWSEFLQLEM